MQPSIDLCEGTRCSVDCAPDARGRSEEAACPMTAFHLFRQTVNITFYPRSYSLELSGYDLFYVWGIAEGCPVLL